MKLKKYYFSCKGSCVKEAVSTIWAYSLEEATKDFAEIKRLPINQFTQLYEVFEDERPTRRI